MPWVANRDARAEPGVRVEVRVSAEERRVYNVVGEGFSHSSRHMSVTVRVRRTHAVVLLGGATRHRRLDSSFDELDRVEHTSRDEGPGSPAGAASKRSFQRLHARGCPSEWLAKQYTVLVVCSHRNTHGMNDARFKCVPPISYFSRHPLAPLLSAVSAVRSHRGTTARLQYNDSVTSASEGGF